METRRDLVIGIVALTVASSILAFISIGVFVRMSPAIGDIVHRNLHRLEASRTMVGVFAERRGEGITDIGVQRLEGALEELRKESKGEQDTVLLEHVVDTMALALSGDRAPIERFVATIAEIAEVDYAAMRRADAEAQRLGSAGAWAAALSGLVIALLGIAVFVRLERRVTRPATELARVLAAARAGDELRRCRPLEGAQELEQALAALNVLLDRAAQNVGPGALASGTPKSAIDDAARQALVLLLERTGDGALVWSRGVGIVAASPAAFTRLASDGGAALREDIARAVAGDKDAQINCETLADGLILCRLAAATANTTA